MYEYNGVHLLVYDFGTMNIQHGAQFSMQPCLCKAALSALAGTTGRFPSRSRTGSHAACISDQTGSGRQAGS
jgi:hypothetical protein